jgi:hypothetical protein
MEQNRKRIITTILTQTTSVIVFLISKIFDDNLSFKTDSQPFNYISNTIIDTMPTIFLIVAILSIPLLFAKWKIDDFIKAQKYDLKMIRFISDYRKDHILLQSMSAGLGHNQVNFFTDTQFGNDGHIEFKYDENERKAAIDFFVVKVKVLHEEAVKIVDRYYEPN